MARTFVDIKTPVGTKVARVDDDRVTGTLTGRTQWRRNRSAMGEQAYYEFTTPQGSTRWATWLQVVEPEPTPFDRLVEMMAGGEPDNTDWSCKHCGQEH